MIRKIYINNLVLKLYSQLPRIKYPLDLNEVLSLIPNCKLMSYQKFADINHSQIILNYTIYLLFSQHIKIKIDNLLRKNIYGKEIAFR